ncbi:MAG: ribonuclease HII, partial [Lachnospiraceae bacterium]|nr:ribonuclease HII [Lachnospiraceae bacterium]
MGERKKIDRIREELRAAEETMLPDFILTYEEDERTGVRKLVRQAEKRLEQYKKEQERIE